MRETRITLSNIIYLIFAVPVLLLGVRFIIELLNLSTSLNFYLNLTNFILQPFIPAFMDFKLVIFTMDSNIVLGIISYVSIAIILEQLVSIPLQTSFRNIVLEIFGAIFKIIEFILVFRLFLVFFNANNLALAVRYITDWSYPLVSGINSFLPTIIVGPYKFEMGTFILLILIVIIDTIVNQIIKLVFASRKTSTDGVVQRIKTVETIDYTNP